MVKINGEMHDAASLTITQYLCENGYDIKRVAVELNSEILPKELYESTILKNGDRVEIVSFVGGG